MNKAGLTLRNVPLSTEMLNEFVEFIDWKELPVYYYKEIPVEILKDHISVEKFNKEISKLSTLRDLEYLKKLLELGADPNGSNPDYTWNPLTNAFFYSYTEAAKILIDAGADMKALAKCGTSNSYNDVTAVASRITSYNKSKRERQHVFFKMLLKKGLSLKSVKKYMKSDDYAQITKIIKQKKLWSKCDADFVKNKLKEVHKRHEYEQMSPEQKERNTIYSRILSRTNF